MNSNADDGKAKHFPCRRHAPLAVARAVEIATDNPDLTMRWDNTVKYSAAWRMKDPSSILTANRNLNDGDANFNRGLIVNRIDLLSEFDLTYQLRRTF